VQERAHGLLLRVVPWKVGASDTIAGRMRSCWTICRREDAVWSDGVKSMIAYSVAGVSRAARHVNRASVRRTESTWHLITTLPRLDHQFNECLRPVPVMRPDVLGGAYRHI
jgi:hypothetical protein